jgi:hypothetical protein
MPIIELNNAKSINAQVRARFANGFKSSNKVYHHPADPALNKDPIELKDLSHYDVTQITTEAIHYGNPDVIRELKQIKGDLSEQYRRRNLNAAAAMLVMPKLEKMSYSAAASALEKIAEGKLAGNCAEMAIFAAQLVNALPIEKGLVHLGSLRPPGDHVFCIVIRKPPWKALPTVNEFKSWDGFSEYVIIDPWLNVCCTASDYPAEVELQLQKWGTSGKRILWQGKFYLPTGTYKQTLMNTSVQFKKYQ